MRTSVKNNKEAFLPWIAANVHAVQPNIWKIMTLWLMLGAALVVWMQN
jgi:hypothetical protein